MATEDADRLSKLFKNVSLNQSRRGSDAGLSKAFYVAPHHSDVTPHSGGSGLSGRESPSRQLCQLHIPPGVNTERRGSTGNILWRKGSAPHAHQHLPLHHHHLLSEHNQRRGSTPGDFLIMQNRKDSRKFSHDARKFSQDSIDLNEPLTMIDASGHKQWRSSQRAIIEEEVSKNYCLSCLTQFSFYFKCFNFAVHKRYIVVWSLNLLLFHAFTIL